VRTKFAVPSQPCPADGNGNGNPLMAAVLVVTNKQRSVFPILSQQILKGELRMAATIADVFIIESLHPDDEGNGRFEGSSISHILRLHSKNPKYEYVRTRKDFEAAVQRFGLSGYRYLHISAHADAKGMCTTNQDNIDYGELAELLKTHLKGKRLFLSACSMVHDDMAKEIIPKTGCYSVVGPKDDIEFSTAAVFWPAIYHLMFSHHGSGMKNKELKENLKRVTDLFEVDIGYYSVSRVQPRGYTGDLLKKRTSVKKSSSK
jgi:hypothetical protein